ncbi:MAG: tRNA pseudouridine(38-40) synthase TruA [Pseudobdellovibrionaceae bacterium]
MQRIRFLVSYDGTDFCGWQKQSHMPNKSVQQSLEEALTDIFQEKITLFASGRTDAGVHAIGQVCHFDTERPIERLRNWDLAWAMKSRLPRSISVKKVWLAPPDFHATLSAKRKTYRYFVYNKQRAGAFITRYADWARHPVNLLHLRESSKFLLGKQDFKSFQSVGSPVTHTVREIYQADWEWRKSDLLQFTITGNGFMKQMVRNIVGTQMMLEKKGLPPETLRNIIAFQDRKQAGPAAPAEGLFLMRVYYPQELDIRCCEI